MLAYSRDVNHAEFLKSYDLAFNQYINGEWGSAKKLLKKTLKLQDNPSVRVL